MYSLVLSCLKTQMNPTGNHVSDFRDKVPRANYWTRFQIRDSGNVVPDIGRGEIVRAWFKSKNENFFL
jgi:hypothetical protein